MKYKNIHSMAHNFVHSFFSLMNYHDQGYIIDDVLERARHLKSGEKLLVQFLPVDEKLDSVFNDRVRQSLIHYRKWLPEHCKNHKVDIAAISLFQAGLVKTSSHQLLGYAFVVDDKGRKYEEYVAR